MKKVISTLFVSLALGVVVAAPTPDTPQQRYIDKYAALAVNEMYRSGIPASITLAQGLLESGAGLSFLAINGNNHFGIKCHNGWEGRSLRADDDAPNECFRSYETVEESFRDHSDFLRYRDRYKFLFDFEITDYKSWAYGLKQAGYATDPTYASKLIQCIEIHDLTRFDHLRVDDLVTEGAEVPAETVAPSLPESPLQMESALVSPSGAGVEQYRFPLDRVLYSRNGVPFVYALEGETYASIAKDHYLFLREILRFNDLSADERLLPGTVVYLQQKKKAAAVGLDKYIVGSDSETLHGICQRFAVREKSIRKRNGLADDYQLREGDELLLRDVKARKARR